MITRCRLRRLAAPCPGAMEEPLPGHAGVDSRRGRALSRGLDAARYLRRGRPGVGTSVREHRRTRFVARLPHRRPGPCGLARRSSSNAEYSCRHPGPTDFADHGPQGPPCRERCRSRSEPGIPSGRAGQYDCRSWRWRSAWQPFGLPFPARPHVRSLQPADGNGRRSSGGRGPVRGRSGAGMVPRFADGRPVLRDRVPTVAQLADRRPPETALRGLWGRCPGFLDHCHFRIPPRRGGRSTRRGVHPRHQPRSGRCDRGRVYGARAAATGCARCLIKPSC